MCTIELNSLLPTWPTCAIILHIIFYMIHTIEGSNVGRYREIILGRTVRIWGPRGRSNNISGVTNTGVRWWGCRKLHALFCDHGRQLARWGVGRPHGQECWGTPTEGSPPLEGHLALWSIRAALHFKIPTFLPRLAFSGCCTPSS